MKKALFVALVILATIILATAVAAASLRWTPEGLVTKRVTGMQAAPFTAPTTSEVCRQKGCEAKYVGFGRRNRDKARSLNVALANPSSVGCGSTIVITDAAYTVCCCPAAPAPPTPPIELAQETVKCVFKGAYSTQNCYSEKGKCEGIGTCGVVVKGLKDEKVTWKSSCGGYATTVIDGQNKYAEFNCAPKPTPDLEAAQRAYAEAKELLDKAQNELDKAKQNLVAAEQQVERAQKNFDAARARLDELLRQNA